MHIGYKNNINLVVNSNFVLIFFILANYKKSMQKSKKLLAILLFTILLLIIGILVWSFFNPYARVMLVPLGMLSIYYLLVYTFVNLTGEVNTKIFYYFILVLIILPLLALGLAYDRFIAFSVSLLNYFQQ